MEVLSVSLFQFLFRHSPTRFIGANNFARLEEFSVFLHPDTSLAITQNCVPLDLFFSFSFFVFFYCYKTFNGLWFCVCAGKYEFVWLHRHLSPLFLSSNLTGYGTVSSTLQFYILCFPILFFLIIFSFFLLSFLIFFLPFPPLGVVLQISIMNPMNLF